MREIIDNYKEYLLQNDKSENTVYAYVTDVNLYSKFVEKKQMQLFKSDNVAIIVNSFFIIYTSFFMVILYHSSIGSVNTFLLFFFY